MSIKIVTDSVADLPTGVASELGITVIPLIVRFGEEIHRNGIDLTSEQFYRRLASDKTSPVTSMPLVASFTEVYDELAEKVNEIIVIVVSDKLSGTYNVAVQSINAMRKKCRIDIVDSQWAVMAEGLIAISAARAAQSGVSFEEVLYKTRCNIGRADFRAAFDTLEYLKRGGRIGTAQAFLGSMLNIHPIITMRNGVVHPVVREHSRRKTIDYLADFVLGYSRIEEIAVEDATTPEDVERLVPRIRTRFPEGAYPLVKSKPGNRHTYRPWPPVGISAG